MHAPFHGGLGNVVQQVRAQTLGGRRAVAVLQARQALQVVRLHEFPGTFAQRVRCHGVGVHVHRFLHQRRVLADRAEQVVVLWQGRQDQAHAARLATALHDRLVHCAEELLRVAAAAGHMHGALGQLHFHQAVAVALVQLEAVAAQAQHLVLVGRLRDAHQRLGVKAVRHHGQFGHRARQAVHAKQPRRAKHRQALGGVVPEIGVGGQRLERLQQRRHFALRVLLQQRRFQFLHQIAKADWVLHVVRVLQVGWLVQRQAGRLLVGKQDLRVIVAQGMHGQNLSKDGLNGKFGKTAFALERLQWKTKGWSCNLPNAICSSCKPEKRN